MREQLDYRSSALRAPASLKQQIFVGSGGWHEHLGVRVSTTTFSESIEQNALVRVFAALDLLRDVAPMQLERIPILMLGLCVSPPGHIAAEWNTELGICMLDQAFVVAPDTSVEWLAAVLVHELTHARLEHAGFHCDGRNRARIERICYLAQRNFLLRLAPSDERTRIDGITADWLAMDPAFWSDEQVEERLRQMVASWPFWRRAVRTIGRLASAMQHRKAR
jgi:hypothetical protein